MAKKIRLTIDATLEQANYLADVINDGLSANVRTGDHHWKFAAAIEEELNEAVCTPAIEWNGYVSHPDQAPG